MERFQLVVKDIFRLKVPFGKDWTGIILINGVKNKILIDSGASKEHIDNYLIPALKDMGLELSDIDYLCCTHCHGDHIGGHSAIKALSDINIACYEKSKDKLADPMRYSIKIRSMFPEHSPKPPAVLEGVKADTVLKDSDILATRLELIYTPGHDNDCICFFDHETSTLISGDSLQGNGTISQGIALCMNISDYIDSIEKLSKMNIENIIAGHNYLVAGDSAIGSDQVQVYLRKCKQVVNTYIEYVLNLEKINDDDFESIAKELITFMGNDEPEYLFLPLYTVKSIVEIWKYKI